MSLQSTGDQVSGKNGDFTRGRLRPLDLLSIPEPDVGERSKRPAAGDALQPCLGVTVLVDCCSARMHLQSWMWGQEMT